MWEIISHFNPEFIPNEVKQQRVWNFVKGDILKLLQQGCDYQVTRFEQPTARQFVLHYTQDEMSQQITIDATLKFLRKSEIHTNQLPLSALLLAVMIRLHRAYKQSFSVTCDYYPAIAQARKLLQKTLQLKTTHNELCVFMRYPMPGKKPQFEKALSKAEVTRKSDQKKLDQGLVRLKGWVSAEVKLALDEYRKKHDLTLEQALTEIIPLGLNIRTFIKLENTTDEN